MKGLFCLTIVTLLLITSTSAQTNDPIKNYPGIPIISDMGLAVDLTPPVEQFQQAEAAGIFTMIMYNTTPTISIPIIENTNLLIVPGQDVITHQNPIMNYTDARYTVFEAEGTPPADGLVSLYSDSLGDYLDRSNGYVSTKSNTPHGTMIYGPMYRQCRNYFTTGKSKAIQYQAKYLLKLEDLPPQDSSPEDTVCILQVTATRTWKDSIIIHNGDTLRYQSFGGFYDTKIVKDSVLRYRDFINIGQPQDFILDYKFTTDFPWWHPNEFVGTSVANIKSDADTGKISQNCVEFKVLWRGKADKVKLSVDKVIVSDQRGRELKNPQTFPDIELSIKQQINNNLPAYNNRIGLFMGIDEPWSIDQWEPIRMVNEIIDAHSPSAKLYINFNVQEDGRFGKWQDPAPGSHAIVIDEFMRRVKKANLWVTGWLYDMPCYEGHNLPPCDQVSDFKNFNIGIFADSVYKRILETSKQFPGLFYGLSVQSGKYKYSSEHNIREINSHELLYQTNLVLMYGAKILFPWLYFGHSNNAFDDYTGFRNLQDKFAITDKYLTLRDTIAPRLKGIMGKTLKTLTPSTQHLNINPSVNANLELNNINRIKLSNSYSGEAQQTYLDLGFFDKQGYPSNSFFMIISRYYTNENIKDYKIDFRNLCNYKNWSLKNYIDGSVITVLADQNGFGVSPSFEIGRGDAILFSILPVVQYGGKLVYNETITNNTLLDDMTIENGAILTVNGTYNAKANITLKAGGKIIAGINGKIIFDAGKKLIVEGNAQVTGVALEFNPATSEGVLVKQSGNLTMSNSSIKNAQVGLRAENNGKVNLTEH